MSYREYPDDLHRIALSSEEEENVLDARYIIKLTPNDPLRAVPESADLVNINPFSGSEFVTTLGFITLAKIYYTGNKEYQISKITTHLSKYIDRKETIEYSLALSGLITMDDKNLANERKIIQARKKEDFKSNEQRMDFYDSMVKSLSLLKISPLRLNQFDINYQYPNTIEIGKQNTSLSPVMPFISESFVDPLTQNSSFSSKIYIHAKNLEKLLTEVEKYRTKDKATHLAFFHKDEYHIGVYNNITNILTIPGSHLEIFTNSVPSGYIEEYQANLKVTWSLYYIQLDLSLFLQAIMTDRVLRDHLIINETVNPTFMRIKSSIELIYHFSKSNAESTNFEILIQAQQLYSDKKVKIVYPPEEGKSNESVKEEILKQGIYYVTFTVSHVKNIDQANGIRHLLSYLIYYYVTKLQNPLIKDYRIVLPKWNPTFTIIKTRGTLGGSLISKLQSIDKEKFPEGYARRCLGERQVDVITKEEKEKREAEMKKDDSTITHFSHTEFPKKEDKRDNEQVVIVTCPSKKYPYIGFKRNIDLPNSEMYPWIPCCYRDNQDKPGTGYRKYLNNEPELDNIEEIINSVKEKGGLVLVDKLLGLGRKANIPNILERVFRNYGFGGTIQRDGVYKSVNSLIHCIMYSVGSTLNEKVFSNTKGDGFDIASNYISIMSLRERERYVAEWRSNIASKQELRNVVKQELYDYTDSQIQEMISNIYVHFDSHLYIRLLEVYFGVSIYVFELQQGNNQYPRLEIPRHRYIYVKNYRQTPAIAVFKHYNATGTVNYELISIHDRNESNPFLITEPQKVKYIYQMYQDMYLTQTLIKENFRIGSKRGQKISVYENVFNYNVYESLISSNFIIIGQYLDHYGKTRGYLCNTQAVDGPFSVLCFPQQPVNLPVIKGIVPLKFANVMNIFPQDGITRTDNNKGKLYGIWYSINAYELGLYVPVKTSRDDDDLVNDLITNSKKAANPLVPRIENGEFSEFMLTDLRLRKMLSIITDLYRYYYHNRTYKGNKIQKHINYLLSFKDKFAIDEELVEDEIVLDIDLETSNVSNFDEAMEYVEEQSQGTLVRDGYIIFTTKKLLRDVSYYLENYLVRQPPKFYTNTIVNNTAVYERSFGNIEELKSWVSDITKPSMIITNAEEISPYSSDPILYRTGSPDSPLFIIQNVKEGDLSRAINVAIKWKKGRNWGYESTAFTESEYVSYDILEIMGRELARKTTVTPKSKIIYEDILILRIPVHNEPGNLYRYAAVLPVV